MKQVPRVVCATGFCFFTMLTWAQGKVIFEKNFASKSFNWQILKDTIHSQKKFIAYGKDTLTMRIDIVKAFDTAGCAKIAYVKVSKVASEKNSNIFQEVSAS